MHYRYHKSQHNLDILIYNSNTICLSYQQSNSFHIKIHLSKFYLVKPNLSYKLNSQYLEIQYILSILQHMAHMYQQQSCRNTQQGKQLCTYNYRNSMIQYNLCNSLLKLSKYNNCFGRHRNYQFLNFLGRNQYMKWRRQMDYLGSTQKYKKSSYSKKKK